MDLNQRIAQVALETANEGAAFFWSAAVAGGWGNPKFPNGRFKPWCAVTASYHVYTASSGKVRLGQGLNPGYRGVYRTGAASVPVLLGHSKQNGTFSPTPAPGLAVLVEVKREKGWTGVPNHIATCTALRRNEDGDIVDVICQDGNYGGKNRRVVRPHGKTRGKERMVGFIDSAVLMPEEPKVEPPQLQLQFPIDFEPNDETVLDAVTLYDDDLWVATETQQSARARVVDTTESGLYIVQVVADDGQVIMENEPLQPDQYDLLGRWDA